MRRNLSRWTISLVAMVVAFVAAYPLWAANSNDNNDTGPVHQQLATLEQALNGRLGVFALDTGNGAQVSYRAKERFPVASTFKALLAASILDQCAKNPKLMRQRVRYTRRDIVFHSPVTETHINEGMTVSEILDAVLKYSDNTGTNLLMKIAGGPAGVTTFVRSIGNHEFRLDSWEPNLNTAPNDLRDTSTPEAMGRSLQRVVLGDFLKGSHLKQLRDGLVGNTVAPNCIRAGVPSDWKVGDRSGGGAYGCRNDIAVLWPPHRAPIILAIYTTQRTKDAAPRDEVIAAATRIIVDWAGRH